MSLYYPKKKVLISLHGIRTRGEWQKELCPLVSEKGWKYYPLDYGYFSAPKLALGFTHNSKVKWFREKMNDIAKENPGALPSIIVHSFGSLILAKAMQRYTDLKFDKVILTGSIIPVDYSWDKCVERGQISFVRNLVGKADFWSKVAAHLPWTGAGNSGAKAFNNSEYDAFLEDIVYEEFGHSDTHYPDVFKARVVPFLEDPNVNSNAPKANYLTYVDPFHSACWSVVTYVRQFVRRFESAMRMNDFHFRHGEDLEQLEHSPHGLKILIPDAPSGATASARDQLEKDLNSKRIVFSQRARSALLAPDGYAYDLPSALESFNVYTNESGNADSSTVAMDYFEDILRDAISLEYGSCASAPEILKLSEVLKEKGKANV